MHCYWKLILVLISIKGLVSANADCRHRLRSKDEATSFHSPNYPLPYPSSLSCQWLLTAPGQEFFIELSFTDVYTESEYDIVEVRDGPDVTSPLLITLSGMPRTNNLVFSSTSTQLLVTFTSDDSVNHKGFKAEFRNVLRMHSVITSTIGINLARTRVVSTVANHAATDRQVEFGMRIPSGALVASFRATIADQIFLSSVERKDVAAGKSATSNADTGWRQTWIARPSTTPTGDEFRFFRARDVIPGRSNATFELEYHQVALRTNSRYTHRIHLTREQLYSELDIDVHLCTKDRLSFVTIPPIPAHVQATDTAGYPRGITVYSSTREQTEDQLYFTRVSYRSPFTEHAPQGGRLELNFDTVSANANGCIFVGDNGDFQHIFRVDDLTLARRRVVFVLDMSGSMAGAKIDQLRKAVSVILHQLEAPQVYFNVILFESVVRYWESYYSLRLAKKANLRSADEYVQNFEPEGATNIDAALQAALDLLKLGEPFNKHLPLDPFPSADYIVFVTDGTPTVGVKSSKAILRSITEQNRFRFGIHTIGLGNEVDMRFLKDLALQNNGKWLHIVEERYMDMQMRRFVADLGRPTLLNITFSYADGDVTSLSSDVLNTGSDIVVSGRFRGPEVTTTTRVMVRARRSSEAYERAFDVPVLPLRSSRCSSSEEEEEEGGFRRSAAILRIGQLRHATHRRGTRDEAAALAKRFNYVTNDTVLVLKQYETAVDVVPTEGAEERGSVDVTDGTEIRPVPERPVKWVLQGDPHFIIQLEEDVNVCFTFGGIPGKIYNLVNDPVRGISARGLIARAPERPPDEEQKVTCPEKIERTYVHTVGISFRDAGLVFVVSPHDVTVYDNRRRRKTMKATKFSDSDDSEQWESAKTLVRVYGVTKMHSFVNVTLKGVVTFIINLHRSRDQALLNHTKPSSDHVDVDVVGVDNLLRSSRVSGIFGRFLDAKRRQKTQQPSTVESTSSSSEGVLRYRNQHLEVQRTEIADPLKRRAYLKCWYTCDTSALLGGDPVQFQLPQHTKLSDLVARNSL